MTDAHIRSSGAAADERFDKYTLPKIALTVILAASLVGTAVSVRLTGWWAPAATLVKWSYFVALGTLAGGLVWKHGFVRPQDLDTGAQAYCAEMYDRFDRIAGASVLVVVLAGSGVLSGYYDRLGGDPLVAALGVALLTTGLAVGVTVGRSVTVETAFRHPIGVVAVGGALTAVVFTAMLEASLAGARPLAMGVRALHLLAFALWIGGAVWNIFVAVPTGQQRPTIDVVRVAGQQLERFRWAVRFIIPTLFATGAYQAFDLFGLRSELYLQTPVGLAVLTKVGFIGLLVVIFKICPMWRACSPIDGVCDLEDLDSGSDGMEVSSDD